MILIVAVLVGVFLGLLMPYNLTSDTLPYVAIALIAALDSVFGGILSYLKKRFNIYIFISGFFTNAILAAILTFAGNKLGVNLSFAAIVVFGTRIFTNASEIRRLLVDKLMVESERKRRQRVRRELMAIEGQPVEAEEEAAELTECGNADKPSQTEEKTERPEEQECE